jgi:hypothetical protein
MDSSNILIDILDEIEIDLILDDNNGSSINTNFEKIKNNIDIIKNLYYNNIYNNISNDISINFQNLRTLITSKKHSCDVNTTNYIAYYKQIKQILGLIICNIYRNSDYHILMANIPDVVYDNTNTNTDTNTNNNTINYVNSEVIFDTVEKYIGLDTIVNVFQVSEHNYLVRFKSYDDSIKTCNMLNKMQIGENIIKVELLCKKPYSLKTEPEAKTEPEPKNEPEANTEPEPEAKTEPEPEAKTDETIVESQYIVEDIKTANVEEYIKSVNIEAEKAEKAEIAEKQKYSNILVVNIAYGIYNKISNIVNYFRR